MQLSDGRTASLWAGSTQPKSYSALNTDLDTDVCIIGAGIAGLTTAYLLQRQNRSVTILSDRVPGDGQTGRTSAHLASAIDDRFLTLYRAFGEQTTKLAYESHAAAIDRIEQIARDEQIDCDFARVDGYLFLGHGDEELTLNLELDVTRLIGVPDVVKLDNVPLGAFASGPCLRFTRQAVFHPLKYLAGLAKCIERDGGRIFTGHRCVEVQGADLTIGESCSATLDNARRVTAGAIVVATNTPAPIKGWNGIYTKQAAYRTYVIGARIPRLSVPNSLYWDTGSPYHYVRIESSADPDHDILLVGGEDHKVGQFPQGAAPFARLEHWARERFKMIVDISFRWSGQVQEPVDGMAYIGQAPIDKPNVYVATGDSGQGLTHGTIAGMLITDLILRKPNPWATIYDPARKPTKSLGEFLSENLNAAATLKEHITAGEVKDESEIAPGMGALIRQGLHKLAVYRDDAGALHRCSSACTHLGCVVQWNHVERTWDCPCHGSRFDPDGRVLMGPATTDLRTTE